MADSPQAHLPWSPETDGELTWFRPGPVFPARPRPLEHTFTLRAFLFGLTRALESLYFPLTEIRGKLFDGELYLAVAPSPMAERDLQAQKGRIWDNARRFADIRGAWERTLRQEVLGYTERMAAFPPAGATLAEIGAELPRLRRLRANQWFAPIRGVIGPAALVEEGFGTTSRAEALSVVDEVRKLVGREGAAVFDGALRRVAERLVEAGTLASPEDMWWLEYGELRQALSEGGAYGPTASARRLAEAGAPPPGPEVRGPALPPDAPRMYHIRDVLALIAG